MSSSVVPEAAWLPLARPWTGEREAQAVDEVLRSGRLVLGPCLRAFERELARWTGRSGAWAVSSGTAALELALEALGVGPGDEVLVPGFGWPSPAHAVARRGARPVLLDVAPDSWNIEPEAVARALDTRTAAVVVVDQYGVPVREEGWDAVLCGRLLLEDAACALGSRFPSGRPCGSLGDVAVLSFHPRKVVTTGEGGALLADDPVCLARVGRLRDHGREGGRFVEPGGNQRLSEIAAAVGLVQLERLEEQVRRRRALATRYRDGIRGWLAGQRCPEGAEWNVQTFGVLLPEGWSEPMRARLVVWMRERAHIEVAPLGLAFHRIGSLAPPVARWADGGLPVAEVLHDRGLALPVHPSMSLGDADRVLEALYEGMRAVEGDGR